LGLLLFNHGFGTATNLNIATMSPKIIENNKGLLVDFKILDIAYLNGAPVSNRLLSISFGDVAAVSFKQAIWKFEASLKGTFSNLSATFTETNPNGDPKLSIIESIVYKELACLVRIDWPPILYDNLLDFLVIENYYGVLDAFYPNRVYVSNFNLTQFDVAYLDTFFLEFQVSRFKIRVLISI
jgi:hypothetical protein